MFAFVFLGRKFNVVSPMTARSQSVCVCVCRSATRKKLVSSSNKSNFILFISIIKIKIIYIIINNI